DASGMDVVFEDDSDPLMKTWRDGAPVSRIPGEGTMPSPTERAPRTPRTPISEKVPPSLSDTLETVPNIPAPTGGDRLTEPPTNPGNARLNQVVANELERHRRR